LWNVSGLVCLTENTAATFADAEIPSTSRKQSNKIQMAEKKDDNGNVLCESTQSLKTTLQVAD